MTFTDPAIRAANRLRYGNLGKGLESAIIASQGSIVCLFKIETTSRQIGAQEWIRLKSPPDFYGSFCDSGRLINFDAKQQGEKDGFHFYKPAKKKPRVFVNEYQRQCLMRAGSRGNGIAGLLIEATHPDVAAYFWIRNHKHC